MAENMWLVVQQVASLFLMMGVGFVLFRRKGLTGEGIAQMTHLLLYVVTPCIVVDSLQTQWDAALLHNLLLGTALLFGTYLVYAGVVLLFFRGHGPEVRAPLRFGAMYSNCGFMGLPLVRAVLGEEAVIYAVLTVVCFNVFAWIHGVALMGGREAASLRRAVCSPAMAGLAVGLPLFLLNLRLPAVLGGAVDCLASLNTPLAMVIIGGQMAQADLGRTFRQRPLYGAAAVKLLLLPAFTALILLPFRLEPLMYATFVILSAAPTAGITAMFAQKFRRSTAAAAQLVTLSTLLSVLTLPLFAAAAGLLAG